MGEKTNQKVGVALKGYDKGVYLFSFILSGILLSMAGFFLEGNTTILKVFTLLISLSLCQSLLTGFKDIKPSWTAFFLGISISISLGLIIWKVIGFERTNRALRTLLKITPEYPWLFVLFLVVPSLVSFLLTTTGGYVRQNFTVTREEIEENYGPLGKRTTIALGSGTIRARVEYPDFLELLPPYFSGTVIIERGSQDSYSEILRVENVLFAFLVLKRINKAFDVPHFKQV